MGPVLLNNVNHVAKENEIYAKILAFFRDRPQTAQHKENQLMPELIKLS